MRWRVAAGDLAAVIAHLICPTGASRRENADVCLAVIARSLCDEAIHPSFTRQDGLLRCARNDG
jgi:hypothetical protein